MLGYRGVDDSGVAINGREKPIPDGCQTSTGLSSLAGVDLASNSTEDLLIGIEHRAAAIAIIGGAVR